MLMRLLRPHWLLFFLVVGAFGVGTAQIAFAGHWWMGYHWFTDSTPFSLQVGDNVDAAWDPMLAMALADWTTSSALDLSIVPSSGDPLICSPVNGRIEVCSANYGNTGWLGLVQVWQNTSTSHVDMARAVLNDYGLGPSDTLVRKHTACQEVGHALGLDHQDITFANNNLGTCMDYSDDLSGATRGGLSNDHPNAHDFGQLSLMYAHNHSIASSSRASSNSSQSSSVSSSSSSNSSLNSSSISSFVSSTAMSTFSTASFGSTGSSGSAGSSGSVGSIPSGGDCGRYPYICSRICASDSLPSCADLNLEQTSYCGPDGACAPGIAPGQSCLSYFGNKIWATATRCFEYGGIKACFHGDPSPYGWTPCS